MAVTATRFSLCAARLCVSTAALSTRKEAGTPTTPVVPRSHRARASPGDEPVVIDPILPRALDPAQLLVALLTRPCPEAAQGILIAQIAAISGTEHIVEHLYVVAGVDPAILRSTPWRHGIIERPRAHVLPGLPSEHQQRLSKIGDGGSSAQLCGKLRVHKQGGVLLHEVQCLLLAAWVRRTEPLKPRACPREDHPCRGMGIEVAQERPGEVWRDVLGHLNTHDPIELA